MRGKERNIPIQVTLTKDNFNFLEQVSRENDTTNPDSIRSMILYFRRLRQACDELGTDGAPTATAQEAKARYREVFLLPTGQPIQNQKP